MAEGRVNIVVAAEDQTKGAFDDIQKGFEGLKTPAVAAGLAIAAGVAAGVAKMVTESIQAFSSFDGDLREVLTLLPDAGEGAFDELTAQALDFGKDMGFLQEDVVPGLYDSLSAGVPRENVFTFMEDAGRAAVAGNIELGEAIDVTSSIMNAYGMETDKASGITDTLLTGVRLGKTTMGELNSSLSNVIPTASAMGVELEEVVGSIAQLTAKGVPTAQATTKINALFLELGDSGTKLGEMFGDLSGMTFKEFQEAGGSTGEAIAMINEELVKTGVPLNEITSSSEAFSAATLLGADSGAEFAGMLEEMQDSVGATDKAFDTMDGGMGRMSKKFGATKDAVLILVGKALEPLITGIGTGLMGVIDGFLPRLEKFIGFMESVFEVVGSIIEPVMSWINQFVKVEDILLAVGIGITAMIIPAISALIPLLVALAAPFAPIIAAMLAIVGVLALLRAAWESDFLGIKTAIQNFWEGTVKPVFEQVDEWLGVVIPAAIEVVKGFFENKLKPAIATVTDFISNKVFPVIQTLVGTWFANLQAGIDVLVGFWETKLLPAITKVWDFIQNSLIPLMGALVEFWGAVLGKAIEVLTALWENVLLPALQDVWAWFDEKILPVLGLLVDVVEGAVKAALEKLTDLWNDKILPALTVVWEFLQDNILPILQDLIDKIKDKLEPVINSVTGFFETLREVIGNVSGKIQSVIGWIQDLATSIGNLSLPDWLTPGSPTPFEIGLVGINSELKQLAKVALPSVEASLNIVGNQSPQLLQGLPLGGLPGDAVSNSDSTVINNYNLTTTASEMNSQGVAQDFELMAAMMR